MSVSTKREQLIAAALRLFNEGGFHATGIDRILAEAGVAKMTLYKHFRSKDELILAALRDEDERQRNRLMLEVERRARTPRDRLLAVFDVVGEWASAPGFRGCPFIRASGEFGDLDDPIHAACLEHTSLVRRYFERLAGEAGAGDHAELARQLMLLFTGALVASQSQGDATPLGTARTAAMALIDAATRSN
ncbi:MAG: TetR/AcrR family transcriptional regulator [Phycisphaeraceae bacterium]|nr:MAG: TetR/AcrR family transcriptional regulator [Phycisphaeraceae bacterium]